MRVIHVITRLIVGGAQENTLASVLGLRHRPDLDVQLVSGPTTGSEGSLEGLATAVPGLLIRVPALVRPVHPWKDVIAWVALRRIFSHARPQIVHTHSGKAGFVGRLAARAARVPVIIHTIHGPSFGQFQGPAANRLFRAAEQWAGRCTTHFVVVADAMTRQYLAAGVGRRAQFTRIFSGFDLEPFLRARNDFSLRARLGLTPEHLVVGKIARLFELKGHADLIAAAPAVVRDLPHARFLLVGDGPARAEFEAEISRRGLGPYFVFTGLVPPENIPDLVGIMDLLVHLSRREGLARALPQALAAGRPVIACDCDGADEVCIEGRTGFLVPPGDLSLLAERIRTLAARPDLRGEFGERGRTLARELFPLNRMIDELDALYRRLVAASTGSSSL